MKGGWTKHLTKRGVNHVSSRVRLCRTETPLWVNLSDRLGANGNLANGYGLQGKDSVSAVTGLVASLAKAVRETKKTAGASA